MNKKHFINDNWDLIPVLIIYSLLSLFLINNYQYLLNADGISYINIAQQYLNLNFTDAINGYWGPLFSWLLIPFLLFGSNPLKALYSIKILSLIIGFLTIIGIRLLFNRFEVENLIKTIILFSLIPIVLHFVFNVITSDLLITCILIYYFYFIFSPKYSYKPHYGFICGVIGSLAYLSKSYALPFFISSFILFNLIYYFQNTTKEKKGMILKNLFLGLTIFFVISGIWIGLISYKYDKFTIGTTGEYNHDLVGPKSQGHPMYYQGLLKLPTKTSISAWEDPSYFKMNSWSPFESWDSFKYQMKLILNNLINTFYILELFSVFSIIIIISCILFIIKSPYSILKNKIKLLFLLIIISLYCGGYSLILVEERYLWIISVLLLLTGAYLLNILAEMNIVNNVMKNILLIFLVISFIIMPIGDLIEDLDAGKNVYGISKSLNSDYNVHGNIASNTEWKGTLHIVYFLKGRYYGEINETSPNLEAELKNNDIDYYLVWDGKTSLNLSDYIEIRSGKNLKIYFNIC